MIEELTEELRSIQQEKAGKQKREVDSEIYEILNNMLFVRSVPRSIITLLFSLVCCFGFLMIFGLTLSNITGSRVFFIFGITGILITVMFYGIFWINYRHISKLSQDQRFKILKNLHQKGLVDNHIMRAAQKKYIGW